MLDRLRFLLNRLREKLWIRPLVMCAFALLGTLLAKGFEFTPLAHDVPRVTVDSVETLLATLSGSMLVIATFAVGSMVASLASAATNATPRTFSLVIADDMSQNAVAMFVGAFIFGLMAIVLVKNGVYGDAGLFALLAITVLTFFVVIVTFIRWMDGIARLGRLGGVIDKVVRVTDRALARRRLAPRLGGRPVGRVPASGRLITPGSIGYVQRIDMEELQRCAEGAGLRVVVRALPGTFVAADRELAVVFPDGGDAEAVDPEPIRRAFIVGDRRTFDEDPRFGLIVLSEIAGRALSPGVNDPGTAIDVIGAMVRLFSAWARPLEEGERREAVHDRVEVPELCADDLFEDAFAVIARDGAGAVEVALRLQKALRTLATMDDPAVAEAAIRQSRDALDRAAGRLGLPADLERVRARAVCSDEG